MESYPNVNSAFQFNKTPQRVGVIGSGNSAHALAAWLSSLGHIVTMYARSIEKLEHIQRVGAITARGKLEGTYPIETITSSMETLCRENDIIFVATIATAYGDIAEQIAPWITPNHCLITFSSKLCGSLQMHSVLVRHGKRIPILETDAIFACRLQEDGSIWIRGHKQWTLFCGINRTMTAKYGRVLQQFFPNLEPAKNLIQRGLTDFGAFAHPVITMANLSKIDRGESFLFYYEGLSNRTISILEAVEREFQSVASAYGAPIIPMKELLNRYYGCDTTTLLSAMTSVPNYRDSVAPATLNHRYLKEDVQCTLIPLQELARKAGLETPTLDAIIHLTSLLVASEQSNPRSLEALGWSDCQSDVISEAMAQ